MSEKCYNVTMKKSSSPSKEPRSDNLQKLLDEVAKFREANQKFLLPNLNDHEVMQYKITYSNHTSNINQIYG